MKRRWRCRSLPPLAPPPLPGLPLLALLSPTDVTAIWSLAGWVYVADFVAVTRDAAGYIERFYNPTRLHSTLDYVSSIKYEMAYALHQMPA